MSKLRTIVRLWHPLSERLHILVLALAIAAGSLGVVGDADPVATPPAGAKQTPQTFELSRTPTITPKSADSNEYNSTTVNSSQSFYEGQESQTAPQQSTSTSNLPLNTTPAPQTATPNACMLCDPSSRCVDPSICQSSSDIPNCDSCFDGQQSLHQKNMCFKRCLEAAN